MTYVLLYCTYDYYQFDSVVYATSSKVDLNRYIKAENISSDDVFEQEKLTAKRTTALWKTETPHYRILKVTNPKK